MVGARGDGWAFARLAATRGSSHSRRAVEGVYDRNGEPLTLAREHGGLSGGGPSGFGADATPRRNGWSRLEGASPRVRGRRFTTPGQEALSWMVEFDSGQCLFSGLDAALRQANLLVQILDELLAINLALHCVSLGTQFHQLQTAPATNFADDYGADPIVATALP